MKLDIAHFPAFLQLELVTFQPHTHSVASNVLSVEEWERMHTFKHEKRRKEFMTGRMALRYLCGRVWEQKPQDILVQVLPSGALAIQGKEDWYVSLAHESLQGVAVIGNIPLGIDIERIQTRHPRLHEYILNEQEYSHFDRLPLPLSSKQILYWTIKEAVLKGLHTGFRISAKTLLITLHFEKQEAFVSSPRGRWHVYFHQFNDCYLAVAVLADQ